MPTRSSPIPGITACCAIVILACFGVQGNEAPIVKVIGDTLYAGTKTGGFLAGDVVDDSTSYDSLDIRWTQIFGPALAVISLPANATTSVTLPDSGTYFFELRAGDGRLTGRDTVVVRVRVNLPFLILRPANRQPIEKGTPFVIRWQMDPSIACTVWYTVDDGMNWIMLTELGSVRDSFVWDVPSGFPSGMGGGIRVEEYQNSANAAAGTGTFVFVNTSQPVLRKPPGNGRRSPRTGSGRTVRTVVLDANGRALGSGTDLGHKAGPDASARTHVLFYRKVDEHGTAMQGKLPPDAGP